MKSYVGTSGWFYDWNKEKSLDWYIKNSGLNAIELNASFYRFPFPNQIKSWAKKTENLDLKNKEKLRWVVKVNRLITHIHKLDSKSHPIFSKFLKLFSPLSPYISFYLFQFPPSFQFNETNKRRIEKFLKKFKKDGMAFEFRHVSFFSKEAINFSKKLGFVFVSVDAPAYTKLPRKIFLSSKKIYLRMHGRESWYSYNYSKKELEEVGKEIKKLKAKEAYVFFNNNHNMLGNARKMLKILTD